MACLSLHEVFFLCGNLHHHAVGSNLGSNLDFNQTIIADKQCGLDFDKFELAFRGCQSIKLNMHKLEILDNLMNDQQ